MSVFHLRLRTSTGTHQLTVDGSKFVFVGAGDLEMNRDAMSLFVSSWLALLSDSPISPEMKPFRLYKHFLSEAYRDLKGLVLKFVGLSHDIVSSHYLMGTSSTTGEWVDGMRETPVFFEYHRYYHTGDVSILNFIYTFLTFGKKVEFVDDEFKLTAFRGWLDIENKLTSLELPDDDVASLRCIIHTVFQDHPDLEFWPKHGPGSVSERGIRGVNQKHSAMSYDYLLDRFLFHGHIGKYGCGQESGLSASKVIPDPNMWKGERKRLRQPARLHFVPKNLKTARSICMEPVNLMFFQQGIADWLSRCIEASPFARFIRLREQSRNQLLALAGSIAGEIDTIDLSAASDSLSYELVRKVFFPSALIPMIATRSNSVELPDGSQKTIKKFAPMGSALCFPTQCIIFASVCVYAAHLNDLALPTTSSSRMTPADVKNALSLFIDKPRSYIRRKYLQPLAVYGDDICCDRRITAYVKSILTRLGFTVNNDKSFTDSQAFRESCGKFYLGGHDLTPLYYSVKGVRRLLSPQQIASQVHMINGSRQSGYHHLASFLLNRLREWPVPKKLGTFSVPFTQIHSDEFGIKSLTPRNDHLKRRENIPYQRDEFRVWSISYMEKEKCNYMHESYSYMRWWAARRDLSTCDIKSQGHISTAGCRVQWRWTPLY